MVEGEKSRLTLYICAAIVAAIVAAVAFPHLSIKLHAGGEIFLRLLKMMVVPLVMASVMSGIIGPGRRSEAGTTRRLHDPVLRQHDGASCDHRVGHRQCHSAWRRGV